VARALQQQRGDGGIDTAREPDDDFHLQILARRCGAPLREQ
jgi:hypothetical protein